MKKLMRSHIIMMYKQLVSATGGSSGVRDESLLDSALNAPFQTFDGIDLYASCQAKAARLGYCLIKDHPMLDGNKRIGIHALLVFLSLNHIELEYTQKELYTIVLDIAGGKKDCQNLLHWILDHQI